VLRARALLIALRVLIVFCCVPGDVCLQLEPNGDAASDVHLIGVGDEAPSPGLGLGLGATSVGEHAFSQMQGDLDQQRLLGERPVAAGGDPLAQVMLREIQTKERSVPSSDVAT